MAASKKDSELSFQQKVWIVVSIVAFSFILLWMIKTTFSVLLLLLAGALIAIYFRGFAGILERRLRFPSVISLPVSIIFSILLLAGFFWFTGNSIQWQVNQLKTTFPTAVENLKNRLNQTPIGQRILEQANSPETQKKASGIANSFFRSTFGVLGDVYVVLFLGIFFTVSPKTYSGGFIKLIPPDGRKKAAEVVQHLGASLRKWLKGQLFAMFLVFVLTAIGLVILGVPMWLVLALMAGLLNFIPNFGPLIAMVPAILIGLLISTTTAILVAALYILVQVLESNIITPQIQKKLLDIPPALIIIAQLFMGVLTGGWGLVLATPLMVMIMVLVHDLYLKNVEAGK